MLTRVLLILSLVPFWCVGCLENAQYGASVLSGPDLEEGISNDGARNEFIGRGIVKDGPLKFGYQSHWWEGSEPDQVHGAFVSHDLMSDPNGVALLGVPLGTPYIGGALTFGENGDMYGPYVGIEYTIQGVVFNTEFHVRTFSEALDVLDEEENDKYKLIIGPVFYFPTD